VLVINAGSSSLKHALVDPDRAGPPATEAERWEPGAPAGAHARVLRRALSGLGAPPDAVGHRLVHGGERFVDPVVVDDEVRAGLEELLELAPLHNRGGLEALDAARELYPERAHVACFDTAFHRTLPSAARTYALPRSWREELGARRFGFHGLNVAYCARRAAALLGEDAVRRLVVCHLGSGSSVTAVHEGRSADTTMGWTPLEGVPMATRSGSIDPAIALALVRRGRSAEEVEHGLNHASGLRGLAGTPDLREVLAAAERSDADASLAVEVMARGVGGAVAAMSTALGGLDCLVFTGGAGEHAPALRAAIAERLVHLGVGLGPANQAPETDGAIGAPGASVHVLVIRAGEEAEIARATRALLAGS